MTDSLFIQRRFNIEKDGISLSDALIIPLEEYNTLTENQITTLKDERFTNHKYNLEHPPVVIEPTKTEKLVELESLRKELETKYSQVEGKDIQLTIADKVAIGGSK